MYVVVAKNKETEFGDMHAALASLIREPRQEATLHYRGVYGEFSATPGAICTYEIDWKKEIRDLKA